MELFVSVRKVEDPWLSTMACSNFEVSPSFPDGWTGRNFLLRATRGTGSGAQVKGRQVSGFQGESEGETLMSEMGPWVSH